MRREVVYTTLSAMDVLLSGALSFGLMIDMGRLYVPDLVSLSRSSFFGRSFWSGIYLLPLHGVRYQDEVMGSIFGSSLARTRGSGCYWLCLRLGCLIVSAGFVSREVVVVTCDGLWSSQVSVSEFNSCVFRFLAMIGDLVLLWNSV
ncbi:hypothetical protein F2Q70_00021467 [Brassica cretica]|uniref:Uncharacterized protein n=1 Tax=Brassica cretica TaxID=69181 RepID=A0A8S9GV46_BRACR|nr:hypothetical protein F2Q70_00021467 [Brassica cretica]